MLNDVGSSLTPLDYVDVGINDSCSGSGVRNRREWWQIDNNIIVLGAHDLEQRSKRLRRKNLICMGETRVNYGRQEFETTPRISVKCSVQISLSRENLKKTDLRVTRQVSREC